MNNGVQTSSQIAKREDQVLRPLREITDVLFPEADRAAGALRAAAEARTAGATEEELKTLPAGPALAESAAKATAAVDELAAKMAQVLQQMRNLAEFHEVIKEAQKLVEAEADLIKRTQREQRDNLFDEFL